MRSALLQLPLARTANERRNVLRAAIRQLERADLYLAAVVAMELDDSQARRTVDRLRRDLEWLRRHLVDLRSVT